MAIEVATNEGGGLGNVVLFGGVLGVGYFGFQWWQREQAKAALLAEAERLRAGGMSLKDALTNAAAGACTVAAASSGIPAAAAGPLCQGAALVAMKAAELAGKGAVVAGKAIGKGTVIAGKAIGHAGAVVGKGVGSGAKFVAYTAPTKIIGGTVNAADRVVTKAFSATIGRIAPKPVKQVATVAKKVAKKVLCLGIFCGLEGIDNYRGAVDLALADASGGAVLRAPTPRRLSLAGRSRSRPSRNARGAYYAAFLAR